MNLFHLATAAALILAQDYNLVVNHKDGSKTTIPIESIESITFDPADETAQTPGSTGTLLVAGIDTKGAFKYDVDKVGDLSPYGFSGSDEDLCWACAGAGMIQWWLDDYKTKTGNDYPLKRTYTATSQCYSTPVMDLILRATTTRTAGETLEFIKWFFAGYYDHPLYGTPSSAASFNAFGPQFNASFSNWRGGFAGMDWMQATDMLWTTDRANDGYLPCSYLYYFHSSNDVSSANSKDEVAEIYSNLTLEALTKGPLYVCVNGNHALSCWGADYKVTASGTRQITHLYICENNNVASNARARVERFTVSYGTSDKFKSQNLPLVYLAGSDSPAAITLMGCLKGYGRE